MEETTPALGEETKPEGAVPAVETPAPDAAPENN